ncbi:MAG: hypothetical protein WCJ71_10355, partial [Candidatus Omnitrophota bacterium]
SAIIYPAKSDSIGSSWEGILNLFRSFTGRDLEIDTDNLDKELEGKSVQESTPIYLKYFRQALAADMGRVRGVDPNNNLFAVHVQIGSEIDVCEFEATLINGIREALDPAWQAQWGFVRAADSAPRAKTGIYHDLMEVFTLGHDQPIAYQDDSLGKRKTKNIFKIEPEGYRFDAPFADDGKNAKAPEIKDPKVVSFARLKKIVQEKKYRLVDPASGTVTHDTAALLALIKEVEDLRQAGNATEADSKETALRELFYDNIIARVEHFRDTALEAQGNQDFGEALKTIGKSDEPGAYTLLSDPDNSWPPLDLDILKRYLMEFIYRYEGNTPTVLMARLFGRRAPPDIQGYKDLLAQVLEMQSRGLKYHPGGNALLNVALLAANPDHGIVEAALEISNPEDTFDNALEQMARRELSSGSDTEAAILGRWGFFGKGGIQNDLYLVNVLYKMKIFLGNMSHDTLEAPWMRPLYVSFLKQTEGGILNRLALYFKQSRWALGEFNNFYKEHEWFKDSMDFYWKNFHGAFKVIATDIAEDAEIQKTIKGALGLTPDEIGGAGAVTLEGLKAALGKNKKYEIKEKAPDPAKPGKMIDVVRHTSASLLQMITEVEALWANPATEADAFRKEGELRTILVMDVRSRIEAASKKINEAPLEKPLVKSHHKHAEESSLGAAWLVLQPFLGPLINLGFLAYLIFEWVSSAWPGGVEMGAPGLAAMSMVYTVFLLILTGKIFDIIRHFILMLRNLTRAGFDLASGNLGRSYEWLKLAGKDGAETLRGIARAPVEFAWSTGLLLQNLIIELRLQWAALTGLFIEAKGVWIPQAFVERMLTKAVLFQYLYLFWPAIVFFFLVQVFVVAVFPIGGMVYLAMQLATY